MTTELLAAVEAVEAARSKIGALCDNMTAGEAGSRVAKRIDDLHDELADAVRPLRKLAAPQRINSVEEMQSLPDGTVVSLLSQTGHKHAWELIAGPRTRAWVTAWSASPFPTRTSTTLPSPLRGF